MAEENTTTESLLTAENPAKTIKRRTWTNTETKFFIKHFLPRQHEFVSRRKIHAYKNVLNDMFEAGFEDKTVTVSHLETKMKSMYRYYKIYKENFPAPAPFCIAPFIKELDIIFDEETTGQPVLKNPSNKETIKAENDFDDYEMGTLSDSEQEDPLQNEEEPAKSKAANNNNYCNGNASSVKQEYYEAKLEFKRRALRMKAKFYGEMKDLFKEKFQREEEMEKEKIRLLTQIADKLCKN